MMLVLQTSHVKKAQPKKPERGEQQLTCMDFNRGRCTRNNCRFAHKCSACPPSATDTNHSAAACPNKAKKMSYSAAKT